ncbi:hypothetical protein GGF46_002219 [Coemansia sp. RSA 552]|nr:hypothetical protein GGF46_002219 [Coemansia sp. RSA 552]
MPASACRLLLVATVLVSCLCGQLRHVWAEPLAMRQVRLQTAWTEYLLSGASDQPQYQPQPAIEQEIRQLAAGQQRRDLRTVHYFDQIIDHTSQRKSTFRQRTYINSDHYSPGGPIYLFNSGETPASPSYLTAGEPYTLAKATNGMLVILEHRYYGSSYPVSDMSGSSMKYLTVDNSLEDVAYFIRNARPFVRDAIGVDIPPSSKWVAVGGSYSATLSVWARKRYPELIHAAYASSAPILVESDFYQYDQVVARALPCAQQISDAVVVLDEILERGDRNLIDLWKHSFGLQDLKDDADFAGALTDQLSSTVQYYMPPAKGSDGPDPIEKLCGWFDNTRNIPLQNMADMTFDYIHSNNISVVAAYSSESGATNTKLHQDGRAWFYQTCTQFGFWQSAPQPPLRRLRSKYVTAKWQSKPCRAFFGNGVDGEPNTNKLNEEFGGLLPNVTRVVYVNGLHDPWSALSVAVNPEIAKKTSESGKNVVITMPLASHVADFYFASSRSDFGVDIARKGILDAMKLFLEQN